jgi:hypothetical protein
MLSSEGKSADTTVSGKQVLPSTQNQSEQGLDREQIFRLIESTLSFEACLYHQILPFNIKDNNLVLGMVNPQDNAAIDYVNRILPYINCTMETQLKKKNRQRSRITTIHKLTIQFVKRQNEARIKHILKHR